MTVSRYVKSWRPAWPSALLVCAYSAIGPSAARAESAPTRLSQSVVFEYPNADPYDRQNLYGFNHAPSVVPLPDGRLLAAWFSGPFEASVHQVILGAYSADNGVSWGKARVLHDAPRRSDFDPAFVVDEKRTWMFFTAGRWNRYPFVGLRDVESVEVGVASFKLFGRWTDDAGGSWSETVRIGREVSWGSRSNGIKLSTGELLLPVYQFTNLAAGVVRSDDGGKTWRRFGEILPPGKVGAAEPSVTQLPSGNLLMVVRSRDGVLWTTTSEDRGTTWSEPVDSGLVAAASSHSIVSTRDGRVLLTHNPCKPPHRTPLTIRVSHDAGTTWGEPLVLATVKPPVKGEAAWSRSVCYPSVTELSDRTILVVWTRIEMEATRQSGVIHAARVRLP